MLHSFTNTNFYWAQFCVFWGNSVIISSPQLTFNASFFNEVDVAVLKGLTDRTLYLHPYTFVVLKETCCIMFISLTRDHFKKTFLAFMFRESRAKMFQRKSSFRSSHRRCSIKKGVFRSFAKLTGKHLCQRLFFNKETVFQKKRKKEKN